MNCRFLFRLFTPLGSSFHVDRIHGCGHHKGHRCDAHTPILPRNLAPQKDSASREQNVTGFLSCMRNRKSSRGGNRGQTVRFLLPVASRAESLRNRKVRSPFPDHEKCRLRNLNNDCKIEIDWRSIGGYTSALSIKEITNHQTSSFKNQK